MFYHYQKENIMSIKNYNYYNIYNILNLEFFKSLTRKVLKLDFCQMLVLYLKRYQKLKRLNGLNSLKLLLIFSVLSLLYIFSQFFRVSNAVIAPNLIQDLGLNAETLGILGGAYFYSFALLQIPMGPVLDRIGPRFVVTSPL